MDTAEKIQAELLQLTEDVRAEVAVSQLLRHTGSPGRSSLPVLVHTDDFFYRRFSKDITRVEIGDTPDWKTVLHIHLSRTGLYDILPEGLFFNPASGGRAPESAAEMAEEHRINKKQEQEIRKFFAPLENDFFYHRCKNFAEEEALLRGLNNDFLNRYFARFWQLPTDMPPAMALRMVLLLPYVHQVTGDAELMAACLQAILDEPAACRLVVADGGHTGMYQNVLSTFELGSGLTCGTGCQEETYCYVFTIGRLTRSAAQDYLEGGRLYSTLQVFYRFFTPAAAGVETAIQLLTEKEKMHIGTMEEATLGIATVL